MSKLTLKTPDGLDGEITGDLMPVGGSFGEFDPFQVIANQSPRSNVYSYTQKTENLKEEKRTNTVRTNTFTVFPFNGGRGR